jgi:hypothetical protein
LTTHHNITHPITLRITRHQPNNYNTKAITHRFSKQYSTTNHERIDSVAGVVSYTHAVNDIGIFSVAIIVIATSVVSLAHGGPNQGVSKGIVADSQDR